MKPIDFQGNSKQVISDFPDGPKEDIGYQLYKVQIGEEPDGWAPMKTVGPGTREITVQDKDGWYRVFYVAKFEEAIYVLHAFQKKTNKTPPGEIEVARKRYKALEQSRKLAAKAAKRD